MQELCFVRERILYCKIRTRSVTFGWQAAEKVIDMSFLFPGEYLDSTYSIDFDKLYKDGYRAVIFDVDNTLVPHGAPADERAEALFAHLKELGYSCMLLSNNKEERVKLFNDVVQVNYIYKANKPMPANYRKAMEIMGTNTDNTLFVGDQIFTDVMGANIAKIRTILVKPIHPKEEIQIILKRIPEKLILFFYKIKVKLFGNKYSSSAKR